MKKFLYKNLGQTNLQGHASQINPFLPVLLLVMVFSTAVESKPGRGRMDFGGVSHCSDFKSAVAHGAYVETSSQHITHLPVHPAQEYKHGTH